MCETIHSASSLKKMLIRSKQGFKQVCTLPHKAQPKSNTVPGKLNNEPEVSADTDMAN